MKQILRTAARTVCACTLLYALVVQAQVTAAPAASAAGVAAPTAASQALSFAQAFDAALGNDHQLRAARFERESSQANVPIARAALLPSASLSLNDSLTKGRREFPNSLNQQVTVNVDYQAPQATLQVRAPIFNWESISRYRQALIQSDAADAIFRVRGTDLVDRLTLAYLQRLMADETVTLAQVQVTALQGQHLRAQQRLQRGEGTRIDVAEASAQLDVAKARLTEAAEQVSVTQRGLQRITGVNTASVRKLPDNFTPPALQPQALDDWLALANTRNPALQARTKQLEVTRLAIQRNMAGHYPRLEAVASMSKSSNESLANLNQRSNVASVGLQLSVPLFSGFGVEASVRQSQSELAKAEAELAGEREGIALELQKQYVALSTNSTKMQAMAQAVVAMEVVLDGVTRGVPAGLRTLAEVLDAQSKLYLARRDLAQARFDYLLSRMRLQALAGAPLAEIVFDIERLLGAAS